MEQGQAEGGGCLWAHALADRGAQLVRERLVPSARRVGDDAPLELRERPQLAHTALDGLRDVALVDALAWREEPFELAPVVRASVKLLEQHGSVERIPRLPELQDDEAAQKLGVEAFRPVQRGEEVEVV